MNKPTNNIDIKELENLVSYASHEFKNPLASIKAYVQLAKRHLNKNDQESLNKLLDGADNQVDRLHYLISNWVDVVRIKNNDLDFKITEVDLIPILHKHLQIELPVKNLSVWGDEKQLENAFNILSQLDADQKEAALVNGSVSVVMTLNDKGKFADDYINLKDPTDGIKFDLRRMEIYLTSEIIKAFKGKLRLVNNDNQSVISIILPIAL